jgi:hypothetical protein
MKGSLAKGRERFELFVAAAVLTNKSHEDCRLVDAPIVAQTKGRLAISLQSLRRGPRSCARTYHSLAAS